MNQKKEPLIEFFLNPNSYRENVESIKHIETHISHVFIAGNYVYKIKKPVNFGFLDFTTLQKRRFYCYREVQLNSRLSKGLYIGVVPIYKSNSGLSFNKLRGTKVVEYAIKMRRLDDKTILSNKIQEGCVLHNEIGKIAEYIGKFHKKLNAYKGRMSIYSNTVYSCEENFSQIKPYVGRTIGENTYNKIVDYTREFLKKRKKEFYERKKRGFIKEIHGDLHSQHISLVNPPLIFDCIEFNNRFRIDDVLNDIAFLIMDLEFNGRFDLSNVVRKAYENCYKEAVDEDFINFYKVYRAVVRGKVEGFISDTIMDGYKKEGVIKKARDYFNLAEAYIERNFVFNPVVFFGLSGSGKSTMSKEFFNSHRVIRSDEVRKIISGKSKEEHIYVSFGKDIYSTEMTKKTYDKMVEVMLQEIEKGKKVILDATFLKKWQRDLVIKTCKDRNLNPFFVYFFAKEDVLYKRVGERKKEGTDISDAHEEILRKQLSEHEYPDELPSFRLLKLNTDIEKEEIVKALKIFL